MKKLSSDIEPQPEENKSVSASPSAFATELSQYKEPANIESPSPETSSPLTVEKGGEQTNEPNKENWRGDSRYYQSGLKAGQLKPSAGGTRAKVSYNKDESPSEISGELITGALFMTFVNMLIPMIISLLNNWIAEDKIKPDDLELTDKQLKVLEPISDRVVKQLTLSANPNTVLFITTVGCFGMNYMQVKLAKGIMRANKENE